MKRIDNQLLLKYLLLLLLAILALAIWQVGPHLTLAQHFPLKEPQKRLALIIALFLAWATKYLLWDQLKPPHADSQNLAQMLHILRGRFVGALRFLKKTMIDKHGFSTPLNTLPWYLLIGPPGSGKTTLLNQSNINFILSKQKKSEDQEKSPSSSLVCDWWVTRDVVLVDVPSCYTFSPMKNSLTDALGDEEKHKAPPTKPHLYLALWQSLLNLLIKYRQKNNLGGLILALHLPELSKLSRQQQTQWFQDLKQRLLECWAKFGKLPVYFIITKCDLLPGFSEFFNDIGSDELMQPWGIPLSGRKEHEKLVDMFTDRFNALIKRLNKQLIWRLHQERNPPLRPLIKDFPLQLEFLKETLGQLIKMLTAANPNLEIEGIYLVSATQENTAANSTTLFHYDVPSALEILPASPFVSRAYFIKHVISYLLPHTSHHIVQRFHQKKSWLPQLAYGFGFLVLLISTFGLGKDFQRGLSQISSVQRYLMQYQLFLQQNNTQDSSLNALISAIPLLNTLQSSTGTQQGLSRLEKIETPYSTQSRRKALEIYHKALQAIVLPQIRNEFEKYLESANASNPEQLYVALKAYLLLRRQDADSDNLKPHPNFAQTSFIIHTLEQISPSFGKKSLTRELTQAPFLQHLQNALQLKQANQLNNRLIKQARKILNSLSNTELAYILVKNMSHNNQQSELNFGTNIGTPPALISKGTMTQIPHLLTAEAFPTVIKQDLPLAAEETINGNAVLGKKFFSPNSLISNRDSIALLQQELEKIYLNNYIDVWESLVDNISINTPKDLTETDAIILNLISTHSPLLQLLQTIHANTDLEPILTKSFKLQALNTLFDQTQTQQKDSLYEIFTALGELHQFLQQAAKQKTENKNKEALPSLSSIEHIRSTAEKYPEPIKNWLQMLASTSQDYLALENKPNLIQKTASKEPSVEPLPQQNPAVLPGPVVLPSSATVALAEKKQSQPEVIHAKKIMTEKLRSSQQAPLLSSPTKPGANKASPTTKTEHADEKNKLQNKITHQNKILKSQSPNGEFIHVLTNNAHPLIFVQKD